ncbi:MAG: hypothetical protein R2873_02070 [Caldilineaceae bacterium]
MLDLTITALYMLMRSTHNDGARADRVILPAISEFNLVDLGRVDELIDAGRAAAEEMIPKIKRDLDMG